MVDLHSHLIWDIDDGSRSKEMTLNMLRQAIDGGTKKIVLTPHYLPGYYEIPINKVKEKVNEISILTEYEGLEIEIYCGQEVYFTNNLLEYLFNEDIGTINNSRYMLIEFNMRGFSVENAIDILYELQLKGIVPVIAHPERYHKFTKNPCLINDFINEGFLFQLNIGSTTGNFGRQAKKTAEIFLENKIYSFIGSDAHRDEKRNPNMREGIEALAFKIKEKKYFNYLMESGEGLLNNEEILFMGDLIKEKKRIVSLFRR